MNGLQIFNNPDFGEIRTISEGENVLFCGADVARALGYSNTQDAIIRHCKGVVKHDVITSTRGKQEMSFIPEPDLYRLVFRSKLPTAEKFTDWVTMEVLPTIRKHGAYMTPQTLQAAISDPDYLLQIVTALKEETDKRKALEVTNSELNRTMTNLDSAWDNGYNTEARSRELAAAYDSYSKMTAAQKREVREFATGTTAKYIEAREKGVTHDNFLKTANAINNAKGTGAYNDKTGKNTVREIDKRKIIAQSGLSEKDIDKMMMVYMEDYDPNKKGSETSELKYNYIRQELGLSPSEYVKAYEVDLQGGKWRDIRKGIQDALGCDWATANSLLLIFEGQKKSTLVNWYNSQ